MTDKQPPTILRFPYPEGWADRRSTGDVEAVQFEQNVKTSLDLVEKLATSVERAAVVKFIRAKAEQAHPGWDRFELNRLAFAIEKGEHHGR